MELNSELREMLDSYLARLWSEELWLADQGSATPGNESKRDMEAYYKARKGKPGAAKFAVRWKLIQKAKKRVNAGYNRLNKQNWKIKDTAPFRNQDEVSQFERMVGVN